MPDPTPAPATAASIALNDVVAVARNVPDLIKKAETIDPGLAKAIEGKALAFSSTPWINVAAGAAGWLSARYGLDWNPETCALVGAGFVLVASFVMRYLSPARITGLFRRAPTSSTVTTVAPRAAP